MIVLEFNSMGGLSDYIAKFISEAMEDHQQFIHHHSDDTVTVNEDAIDTFVIEKLMLE